MLPNAQLTNGADPGSIFIAQGQMKQQVNHSVQPQPRELLNQLRPNALQRAQAWRCRFDGNGLVL